MICPVQGYAWGSVTAIPELLGTASTGAPQAELWMGTHERGPATIARDGSELGALVDADPIAALGADTAQRFDGALPYLMKILAAASPLSIQAHPNKAQAEAGFALENAAGIALDAPNRSFRDDNHKPELICALSPFVALCGFRDPDETARLYEGLGVDGLSPIIVALRTGEPAADRVRAALSLLLRRSESDASRLTADVGAACRLPSEDFSVERRWAATNAHHYPDGPGVVAGLMLNLIQLEAGEALFLGAGNLHAYLQGTGIEVMAISDNVLRGGMTRKHVDVDTLLEVVDTTPGQPRVQRPSRPVHLYDSAVADFALTRIAPEASTTRDLRSGEIVLSIAGDTTLEVLGEQLRLAPGEVAWVPAHHERCTIGTGKDAIAFVASVGMG